MALRVSEEEYNSIATRLRGPTMSDLKEPEAKPSKYRNKKVVIDGIEFDSLAESRRWFERVWAQKRGEISELRRQIDIPIYVNGVEVCFWRADHVYMENGVEVWEDVKGKATDLYLLKKKLIEACYGKQIREVKKVR